MNQAIEDGWNDVVTSDDIVIYLGDLSLAKTNEKNEVGAILKRLNGTVHYVLGNHDKIEEIKAFGRFQTIQDYLEVKITHQEGTKRVENLFCCFHYPIYSWNKAHHGSYQIHGHCHMSLSDGEFHKTHRILDVGCNGYSYTPISFSKIIELKSGINYQLSSQHH